MTGPAEVVDLAVLGSGAAGLTAAAVAAARGARVLVVETADRIGGTTARSAGTCWVPGNRHLRAAGVDDDLDQAARYLDELVGDRAPGPLRTRFLTGAHRMVDELHGLGVRFRPIPTAVDYHEELPGARYGGRALEPEPFDARRLGPTRLGQIRAPIAEFGWAGGAVMVRRTEAETLRRLRQGSPAALALAARLTARRLADRRHYPRGTRLTMGNALIAALLHALEQHGGRIWLATTPVRLIGDERRVSGVEVVHRGRVVSVLARSGVVLAGGGFAADDDRRRRHLPTPTPEHTAAAPTARGDTIDLACRLGAAMGDSDGENAVWFPASVLRHPDGHTTVFPHIWDRARPGVIAVDRTGRRYTDESRSYHHLVRATYAHGAVPSWLICDARTLHRYGLGLARPYATPAERRRLRALGYLHQAGTVAALAHAIGADPTTLERTVAAACHAADVGVDHQFGRGRTRYARPGGDPRHHPNPNLGRIERAPLSAVAIVPTPIATTLGLRTDPDARVLTGTGAAIPGLYCAGNDAQSTFGSEYPGAGAQIAKAMTFAYLAAVAALHPDLRTAD